MTTFRCRVCRGALTGPVREVPAARLGTDHPRDGAGEGPVPVLAQGLFAVDPDPGGGVPGGSVVLHPGALVNVRRHPDPSRTNGCCGLDGLDGPNLVCAGCGAEVVTFDDCRLDRSPVRLVARAVRGG